jgi:ubiquitin carboxyl-terminal hydrolase L5
MPSLQAGTKLHHKNQHTKTKINDTKTKTPTMADSSDWCTIESDPGVFTSLIESFGVKNVELTELWSLDDDSLKTLTSPIEGCDNASVFGLIFLFKWQRQSSSATANLEGRGTPLTGVDVPEGLFFAQQTVQNACATQAILSVLLNARNAIIAQEGGESKEEEDDNGRRLVLGQTLSNFKEFVSHFSPDLRGEAIGSSEEIRTAHNSFGRSEDAFLSDPTKPKRMATDDDDVFHFIAYVPHDESGCVYELDGLQQGPIRVGEFKKDEADDKDLWIKVARDAIQARLSNYSPTEIKFNLMAIVQDRRTYLNERLNALAAIGVEENDPAMVHIQSELHAEEEKRAQWALENARRRHVWMPFCVELLRALAGSGKMDQLMTKAKTTAAEKRKRAEEWKQQRS